MTSNVTILKSIAMSILLHTICGSFKTVLGRRPSANVYSTTSIATSTSTRMHRLHSNYNAAFQFGSFSTCRNTRSEFGLGKELPSQSRLRSKSKLYYLKEENRKNNKDFNKGFFSPSVYSRNFSKFASIESEQIETDTTPTEEGEEDSLNDYEFDVILDSLNDAQIKAVTQPTQSITRVVAGPGAGKTRVLTCRIAYLLKRDIIDMNPNSRILAVTFTKKASTEMQHRLNLLLRDDEEYQNNLKRSMVKDGGEGEEADIDPDTIVEEMAPNDGTDDNRPAPPLLTSRVTLGTFHSICAKILRWHGKELDSLPTLRQYLPKKANDSVTLDGSFAIIDQSEQMRIIKQCLTDCGIDLKGSGTRGQADIRPVTILNAVGQIKSDEALDVMSGDRDNEKSNGRKMSSKVRRIAEEVYPLYRKALLAQNSLDFDDLILMARELLKTNTEVRERMQKRWQHILVDEFQDTSEVQLDLVKLLSTSSLLIVGDGDQSIYSWRGAHAESMSDFVKEFNKRSGGVKQKEVDTVFLMENYR
jgi:DNA helicase-2/ATP-dependent DNA helicase PcrA